MRQHDVVLAVAIVAGTFAVFLFLGDWAGLIATVLMGIVGSLVGRAIARSR